MKKSILCAVDLGASQDDNEVLKTAARLAALDDAQLDVVTVIPDYGSSHVGGFFDKDFSKKLLKETQSNLSTFVEGCLGQEVNADVRHVVVQGTVYAEVLKTAEAANSDLIVVGAHNPDLKDFLLGPNAARIVRHSTCSVYVVR